MSAPGWYPDPSQQGRFRWWDGRAWTAQTTGGQQAPTPGGPAGPGLRPGGTGRQGRRWAPWVWFGVAAVVVLAIILAMLWRPGQLFGLTPEDTNSARPTGSQWDELPSSTPTIPDTQGPVTTIECPQNSTELRSRIDSDGRMRGGGLSFEARRGWRGEAVWMPWLYDHNSQIRTIREATIERPGWMSNLSIGYVLKSEGFTSPRQAAESLMSCLASSDLYLGFSGRDDYRNQPFSLDGHDGWRITAEVFVDNQDDILGDEVDVIVLDTGDPDRLSVFISCATIGLQDNLDEVAQAMESLRVE